MSLSTPTSTRRARLAAALAYDPRPIYQIAAAASVVPNDLSAFVSGRKSPTNEQADRIASVLAVDVSAILDSADLK